MDGRDAVCPPSWVREWFKDGAYSTLLSMKNRKESSALQTRNFSLHHHAHSSHSLPASGTSIAVHMQAGGEELGRLKLRSYCETPSQEWVRKTRSQPDKLKLAIVSGFAETPFRRCCSWRRGDERVERREGSKMNGCDEKEEGEILIETTMVPKRTSGIS